MALVTDVKTPLRGSKRRMLEVDHSDWRETSSEVLAALGIRAGTIMPLEELEAAIAGAEPARARERALRLLSYRERGAQEVRARLAEDGYPAAVVGETVAALVETGLVDDERFAAMTARALTRVRGMGRSRATRDLIARGVDPDVANAAVDEALPPDEEARAAAGLAHAMAHRPDATVEKVAARLVRKGYATGLSLRCAREAIEATGGTDGEAPDGGPWEPDGPSDLHQDHS